MSNPKKDKEPLKDYREKTPKPDIHHIDRPQAPRPSADINDLEELAEGFIFDPPGGDD